MKKKKTKTSQKKKLWKLFSKFIRERDGYTCFTCGKYAEGSGMHAGHFITGATCPISLYFDERNVHAQCLTGDSNLKMEDGSYKPIGEVEVGDFIQSFDDERFFSNMSIVLSTHSFMPDTLYEVEMENGRKFQATGDHKVVSNGKWLRIDEMLHDVSAHDILEI